MNNLQAETVASESFAAVDLRRVAGAPGIAALKVVLPGGNSLLQQAATAEDRYAGTYEAACRTLAVSGNIAEVTNILAVADAMDAHARQAGDRTLEWDAIELRFHAECRLDQLTAEQDDQSGLPSVA